MGSLSCQQPLEAEAQVAALARPADVEAKEEKAEEAEGDRWFYVRAGDWQCLKCSTWNKKFRHKCVGCRTRWERNSPVEKYGQWIQQNVKEEAAKRRAEREELAAEEVDEIEEV